MASTPGTHTVFSSVKQKLKPIPKSCIVHTHMLTMLTPVFMEPALQFTTLAFMEPTLQFTTLETPDTLPHTPMDMA